MNAVIWSGAADAADIFFLIAAILAGISAVVAIMNDTVVGAGIPAAVCLVALGLLAL